MSRMKNETLDRCMSMIQENAGRIEEELECRLLFGAVSGSISLNLSNASSDVDCCLVVDGRSKGFSGIRIKRIDRAGMGLDCFYAPLREIEAECITYGAVGRKYPTRFYRSQEETDEIVNRKDHERPGFLKEMVMRIYLADKRMELQKGSVENAYGNLKEGLRLIDIWDAYFSRAYGNYWERIREQEQVSVRKYLYTISEIMVCRAVLKGMRPVMDFEYLVGGGGAGIEQPVLELCRALWEKNRCSSIAKEKSYTLTIPYLNIWIENQLEELVDRMRKKEDFLKEAYLPLDKSESLKK